MLDDGGGHVKISDPIERVVWGGLGVRAVPWSGSTELFNRVSKADYQREY